MTQEEKAKAYDKLFIKAKRIYNKENDVLIMHAIENLFPELKESEDERIRKELIDYHRSMAAQADDYVHEAWIAWLEKQGEQKPVVIIPKFRIGDNIKTTNEEPLTITKIDGKGYWSEDLFICGFDDSAKWELVERKPTDKVEPKFKVGDWVVISTSDGEKVVQIDSIEYFKSGEPRYITSEGRWFGNGTESHLWTIQDAKPGDVIFCKGNIKNSNEIKYERICLFNNLDNAFFTLTRTSNYVEEYDINVNIYYPDNTVPATKEQNEILFMAMADAGYTFDFEKKELNKIEQKSADSYCQENCKGFQETGKCFADWDCKAKREAESIDKAEPKFREGQWITNGYYTWKIVEVRPLDYILQTQDGNIVDDTIPHVDEQFHSFTIEDAKDGDVVADKSDGAIGIFQSIGHHSDGGSYNDPSYCFLHCRYDDGFFYADFEHGNTIDSTDIIPATKEQHVLLFQKMKEAGYEWDAEKKELKKIEQKSQCMISAEAKEAMYDKPAWSEEDKDFMYDTLSNLTELKNRYGEGYGNVGKCIDWLTSLKQRIGG